MESGKISGNSIEYYKAVMRKAGDLKEKLTKEEKEIVELLHIIHYLKANKVKDLQYLDIL